MQYYSYSLSACHDTFETAFGGANVNASVKLPPIANEFLGYNCPSSMLTKDGHTDFSIKCQDDGTFSSYPTTFLCLPC